MIITVQYYDRKFELETSEDLDIDELMDELGLIFHFCGYLPSSIEDAYLRKAEEIGENYNEVGKDD